VKVNGYPVQTRLLSTNGQTTCTTLQWNGQYWATITMAAQPYDDIDFTPCLGTRVQGAPVTIELVNARYEYRCMYYGIDCPIGNVYQTHVAQGDIWIQNDASVLPPASGTSVSTRRCDQP
jgi:hypothetical protein